MREAYGTPLQSYQVKLHVQNDCAKGSAGGRAGGGGGGRGDLSTRQRSCYPWSPPPESGWSQSSGRRPPRMATRSAHARRTANSWRHTGRVDWRRGGGVLMHAEWSSGQLTGNSMPKTLGTSEIYPSSQFTAQLAHSYWIILGRRSFEQSNISMSVTLPNPPPPK